MSKDKSARFFSEGMSNDKSDDKLWLDEQFRRQYPFTAQRLQEMGEHEQGGVARKQDQEKQHQGQQGQRRAYWRGRRQAALLMFLGSISLTLIGLIFLVPSFRIKSDSGLEEQTEKPSVAETEGNTSEESAPVQESAPIPPDGPTMFLTIPKLNIYDARVTDDVSEEVGLALGVGHMPGTGFPWEKGTNTYIVGYRLGYPETASYRIFYDLPSLEKGDEIVLRDINDQEYDYLVSDVLQVLPDDLSVMEPVEERDMVSLRTCIEDFGDFATLGPDCNVHLVVQADLVAYKQSQKQ
jgi:LPXTG-site transpeptidase (sortase) family protein